MNKQQRFLLLIQTAALERALKAGDPTHDSAAPTLAQAMRIHPHCLPDDLNAATFEAIDWLMCGGKRPEWVKLEGGLGDVTS